MIDIYSKGEFPANVLSNFYPNSFVFDGVECASMEGFLQSLKYRNIEKQKSVCGMVGKEAKAAGSKKRLWKLTGNLYWKGKRYKRNSEAFDELRYNAYKALLCNETFRAALDSVNGRELKHSIGKNKKRTTILTEEEFIGFLNLLTTYCEKERANAVIEMRLADEPFGKIVSGEKTVEIRLYDEKRRVIVVGDTIVFHKGDSREPKLTAIVVGLHRFDSFIELFQSDLYAKTGCCYLTPDEAANSMYAYYSKEQEEEYGVLGIEIKLQ